MSDNTVFMLVGALFVVVGLGVFFLLAWKLGPRSGDDDAHMTAEEIHITA
jgi:NADH:ubiquinone oxidoreductase subunit 3 (subunit A)